MKLTTVLLLAAMLQATAKSDAQTVTYAAESVSLEKVFVIIKQQTGYVFFYREDDLTGLPAVSVSFRNTPLATALQETLKGQPLQYNIQGKTIFITTTGARKKINTIQEETVSEELSRDITGVVRDKKGAPLEGVSITIKGTQMGTTTNADGRFQISVPSTNGVELVFSFVGYTAQTVKVGSRVVFDIILEAAVSDLSDVVVVGYGTQKKINMTGVVSEISRERLEKRTVMSLDQALQGVVPGLNLTTNSINGGEPNAKMNMSIRGVGSLSGGGPYILVDGAPMDINDVDMSNVESISILKDAASTAIYGSRAAYGVILITTKSGHEGKIKTGYSNYFAWSQPTYLPGFVNSLAFANAINTAAANSGQSNIFSDGTIELIKKYQADPKNTPSMSPNPNDPNGWGYWNLGHANTDWYDVLYKDLSFSQKHNINISGGSKSANYYLGVGWTDEGGLLNFAHEKFQRFNITSNVSFNISKNLSVSLRSKFNRDYQRYHNAITDDRNYFFSAMTISWPTDPVYTPNGDFALDKNQPPVLANGGSDIEKITAAWFTPSIKLKITKDWTITADMTYNYSGSERSIHKAIIWGLAPDGVTMIKHYYQNWNREGHTTNHNEYITSNVFTEFSKQLNRHHFDVLAGGQIESSNNFGFSGWRRDLITDLVPSISTATGDKDVDDNMSSWSTRGYFGRLTYNFDEKYLLELDGRYDGSSKFQSGKRWGFFPSASVGYNISKEGFWLPIKHVINNLKIRASYGAVGNQNVPSYLFAEIVPIQTNLSWIMNGARPLYATVPYNRSIGLTWETAQTLDFGIDGTIFKNKLGFTLDWYTRKTINMFGPGESLPAIYGAAVPLKNNATLETKGIELSVNWKDIVNEKLNYSIQLAFSNNKTIITKYNNPTKLISNFYEGGTYGDIWGFATAGIFQSDEEVSKWVDQSLFYPRWGAGDIKYEDINNDGKITIGDQTLGNTGDMKVIGNSQPRYLFSINTNINFKSFDFSMFWQGVGKRDIWMTYSNFFGFGGAWTATTLSAQSMDFWRTDNPDAYFAKPYLTAEVGKNQQVQTRFLQNASYVRLKSLQIGYSLPGSISEQLRLDKVRLFIGGENLLTFSGMRESFDPETNVAPSGTTLVYPLARIFSTGINITF